MGNDEETSATAKFNASASDGDLASTTLLSGKSLVLVFTAFCIAFMLIALDQTILSTALPTIASHFHAVSDLSWIASAYFLPQAAFMLFFGRVLAIAPAKPVFLITIAIFELGSLLCAVSPSVNFLIFGRAVAGLGAAGLWVSIMSIIARVTTLAQRPLLMGLFGAVYAVSSIIGPLIGGAFSDHVSWRWCFYINLPLGAMVILFVVMFLPNNPAVDKEGSNLRRWLRLDWIGTLLSFGMVTSLMIALQWGGNAKPWNSPTVIVLFVLFGVFLVAFLAWEYKEGQKAVLPLEIFLKKTIFGTCLEALFVGLCFMLASYYLPLFYQIRGHSATHSGIDILPFMITGVIASVVCGGIITVTGYIWPFLFVSPAIAAVAFGLLYTTGVDISTGKLIGYQIIVGVGLGACIQNTIVIAQAEFADNEALVPQATSIVTFSQLIGSSVGLAISGAVFSSELKSQLHALAPNLPPDIIQAVLESVKVIFTLSTEDKAPVVLSYVNAVDRVFLIGVPAAALGSLSAILISRRKIQTPSPL